MQLSVNKINKSLSPSYRLLKPKRSDIEAFKTSFGHYLSVINSDESEENLKTHLMDFLKTLYSPEHLIEQQKRIDFVIRTGKKNSNAGVLFEAKRFNNTQDMISQTEINKKALHELVLYFMEERKRENTDIKYLIICNEFEVYIFEAKEFERAFYKNSAFRKDFIEWSENKKSDNTTDFFYNSIAKPFIAKSKLELHATYFDIRDFSKLLKDNTLGNDLKLMPLFKVLSPEHLLKKSYSNDSNSLNKQFYDELLHIIGLEETKNGSKKVIQRLKENNRNDASLLEMAIVKAEKSKQFYNKEIIQKYGMKTEERAFSIALELCITWVNRLLFLKLLEGQLVQYNQDKSYKFLNQNLISDYDELHELFFDVLAYKPENRDKNIQQKYIKIPYLNSSLFEETDLEELVGMNSFKISMKLPLFNKTALKDIKNKPKYKEISTLNYIFEFLEAYDFASDGAEEIQEESKTLINASVLGLIFEKINGYQEGAIFTPGYITAYMSKTAIEKTVLEKFQEAYPKWKLSSLDDLNNHLADYRSKEDTLNFNDIINQIKICDPAVGSGHFLVSCLNEIISIKSKLGLLADKNGNRLSDYEILVENDEIIITHSETTNIFQYSKTNQTISPKIQNVQKTLFREKQHIIENCLFGVDINPNSVKICQLRLWIELLKNSYYTEDSKFECLETLPNIDINIKCGNSLLSRFTLEQNLSEAFNKGMTVSDYRKLVNDYKETRNRQTKRDIIEKIDAVKSRFKDEELFKLEKELSAENQKLAIFEGQDSLFETTNSDKKADKKKLEEFKLKIKRLEDRIEKYKTNTAFLNSLEWRFEFPEVLDNKGKFLGFDIIIANPPYMRVQEIEATQPSQKAIYEKKYNTAKGSYDLANLFFELAVQLSHEKSNNIFIFPHKLFNSANGESLREYLLNSKAIKHLAHFGANMVFDSAITYTCIALFNKKKTDSFSFQRFPYKSNFKENLLDDNKYQNLTYANIEKASKSYGSNQWIFFDNDKGFDVFDKIYKQKSNVSSKFSGVYQGIATSKDLLYIVQKTGETPNTYKIIVNPKGRSEKPEIKTANFEVEKELFKPFLMGKDVHRYQTLETDKLVFFPYTLDGIAKLIEKKDLKKNYPLTYKYVEAYKNAFEARESGKAKRLAEWYAYIYPKNLDKFEQEKLSSMEICSIHPNVTINDSIYHTTKVYSYLKNSNTKENYLYFLSILNSNIFWWFLKNTGDTLQGDARTMKTNYLNPFPLPESVNKSNEDDIVKLVKALMNAKKKNDISKIPSLEKQINKAVYDLYDLDSSDIKLIESGI